MTPCAALLSNGRYRVFLSGAGAGASCFEDLALTRWSRDGTRDAEGVLLYVQDLDRGLTWAADLADGRPARWRRGAESPRPRACGAARRRREHPALDVCVDPGADRELRVLTLYTTPPPRAAWR